MTRAVDTGITAIEIFVLLEWTTRALVRSGDFNIQIPIGSRCHVTLHGMGTFVYAIDRHGQHDQKDQSGKEFERD